MAGVSKSAPIVGSSPLFATMLAISIGGESINTMIAIGTLSIIGGLAMILSQR
jgi:drug/metabolite transporter (DMT)-like permease